jgi:hypothetical protein
MTTPAISVSAAMAAARFAEALLALSPPMLAIVVRASVRGLIDDAVIAQPRDRAALLEALAAAMEYLTELKPDASPDAAVTPSARKEQHDEPPR